MDSQIHIRKITLEPINSPASKDPLRLLHYDYQCKGNAPHFTALVESPESYEMKDRVWASWVEYHVMVPYSDRSKLDALVDGVNFDCRGDNHDQELLYHFREHCREIGYPSSCSDMKHAMETMLLKKRERLCAEDVIVRQKTELSQPIKFHENHSETCEETPVDRFPLQPRLDKEKKTFLPCYSPICRMVATLFFVLVTLYTLLITIMAPTGSVATVPFGKLHVDPDIAVPLITTASCLVEAEQMALVNDTVVLEYNCAGMEARGECQLFVEDPLLSMPSSYVMLVERAEVIDIVQPTSTLLSSNSLRDVMLNVFVVPGDVTCEVGSDVMLNVFVVPGDVTCEVGSDVTLNEDQTPGRDVALDGAYLRSACSANVSSLSCYHEDWCGDGMLSVTVVSDCGTLKQFSKAGRDVTLNEAEGSDVTLYEAALPDTNRNVMHESLWSDSALTNEAVLPDVERDVTFHETPLTDSPLTNSGRDVAFYEPSSSSSILHWDATLNAFAVSDAITFHEHSAIESYSRDHPARWNSSGGLLKNGTRSQEIDTSVEPLVSEEDGDDDDDDDDDDDFTGLTSFLEEDSNDDPVVWAPDLHCFTAQSTKEIYIDTRKTEIKTPARRCPDPRTSSGSLYYLRHSRKQASSNRASIGCEQSSMPSLYSPSSLLVVALVVFVAVALILNFAPMVSYLLGYLIETVPFLISYTISAICIWISTLPLLLSYFLAYLLLLLLMFLPFPRESTASILLKNPVTGKFGFLLEQIHEYRCLLFGIVMLTIIILLLVKCFTIDLCRTSASILTWIKLKVVKSKETTSGSITDREKGDDLASEKCHAGEFMKLFINMPDNKKPLTIAVEPDISISKLKEKISDLSGHSACRSRLVFLGTELSPPNRICDYGICEGSKLHVTYVGVGGATLISEEMKQKFATIPREARYFYWSRDELIAISDITQMDTDNVHLETMRGNDVGFKELNLRKLNPCFKSTGRYYMPVASTEDSDPARSLMDQKKRTTLKSFSDNRVYPLFSMLYLIGMLITCSFTCKGKRPASLVSRVEQYLNSESSSPLFNRITSALFSLFPYLFQSFIDL